MLTSILPCVEENLNRNREIRSTFATTNYDAHFWLTVQ